MMKKIISAVIAVFAVLAAVTLAFGVVLVLAWPLWVGFFILLVMAGIATSLVFARQIVLRRREERFVSSIVAQDEEAVRGLEDEERRRRTELQEKFKQAVGALRASHLRKLGNPLYVLPWYMVIGESGSGKTTAIKSARLSSPFAEAHRVQGVSGTRNCDWWFFEQAVILDTAGRYAIPVDEGRDLEEWQRFLGLLARYRRREPLSGLVVTIAADRILGASPEELEEEARQIRRRMDELMRSLGSVFPVYVLVSKCDLVQGMTRFCDRLDEEALKQAFGMVKKDPGEDCASFVDRALEALVERLRYLRLIALHDQGISGADPALLLFPEEFSRMKTGLAAYVRGAFQENPYQETPLLRGVYFSSGRQEGAPYSHFLKALGLVSQADVLPGTNRGLFLHDFFAKVLPADRGLAAPTRRALAWQKTTLNLALMAWLAFGIGLSGLLSFSFVKNLSAIRSVPASSTRAVEFSGEPSADVLTLSRYRDAVSAIHERNSGWWIPRFGLDESIEVEQRLKARFCSLFDERFLRNHDARMAASIESLDATDETLGDYIISILGRIKLIRERTQGGDVRKTAGSFLMLAGDTGLSRDQAATLSELYLQRVQWEDEEKLAREARVLESMLVKAVKRSSSLDWLVKWVNAGNADKKVTFEDFWGEQKPDAFQASVDPAYTKEGRALVRELLADLDTVLGADAPFASRKEAFLAAYRKDCMEAWHTFAVHFPKGASGLKDAARWRESASKMATRSGPYQALLARMVEEARSIGDGDRPAWVQGLFRYQEDRELSSRLTGAGSVSKAAEAAARLKEKLQASMGGEGGTDAAGPHVESAKALREYEAALAKISASVSVSRAKAYQSASVMFGEDNTASPFYAAKAALDRYAQASGIDRETLALIGGPLDFLWQYTCQEAACYLQEVWEKDVLADAQGIADSMQLNQVLFAPDGLATKFIKGPAAPFVGRDVRRGFYPREVLGRTLPFEASFLDFFSRARVGLSAASLAGAASDVPVSVTGYPTEANDSARVQPHATRLAVQCMDSQQVFVNMNYPATKTLMWSPQRCAGVTFSIEVGNLVLTKTYTGQDAFAKFLLEFKGGARTFTPQDFPREENALKSMGIRYIKVQYRFSGHQAVISQAKPVMGQPSTLPVTIARCPWR